MSKLIDPLLATLTVLFIVLTLRAASAGAPAELITACREDAQAVCSWPQLVKAAGGNYKGVAKCFRSNQDKLSATCRRMIEKYGYK